MININVDLNQYQWTAMHRAAYDKDLELIDALIKCGEFNSFFSNLMAIIDYIITSFNYK